MANNFSYSKLLQAISNCMRISFNFTLNTAIGKERHHRTWTFSIVPRTFTHGSARDRRAKKKYIKAQKPKTLSAVLTGERRPSTNVIHSGSAVRPKLQEPWCSI